MDRKRLECFEVYCPDIVVMDVVLQNLYLVIYVTRLIYKYIVIVLDIVTVEMAGKIRSIGVGRWLALTCTSEFTKI